MLAEYIPILPLVILVLGGMAIMLLEPFTAVEKKYRMCHIAVLTTALAAYSLGRQGTATYGAVFNGMFMADGFTFFFQWLFLLITGTSSLMSLKFNQREAMNRGEYYALLLFACSGMSLMAASADLVLTFLGLEILSVATYVLAGFKRNDDRSNEASLKYFLLGSFASAFLLYGIALTYGAAGSTKYQVIRALAGLEGTNQMILMVGLGLLLVGFGFKVAAVPFHAWAPDVYEGAPTPVTAFMTVGPKAAGFAALVRILAEALPAMQPSWSMLLWVASILTMTVGNLVAVLQTNVKRMLAYSSIAHAGYILVGLVAHNRAGYSAVLFYLVIYTVMNLGAFCIVLSLSRKGDLHVSLEDYSGLARKAPLAAAALSIFLVSLAGIPLTGGFMGKFYLFSAAVQQGYIGLAIIGVLNSVLSVFYYFRLMVVMYMKEAYEGQPDPDPINLPVMAMTLVAALGVLWLGLFPSPFLNLAANSTLTLK